MTDPNTKPDELTTAYMMGYHDGRNARRDMLFGQLELLRNIAALAENAITQWRVDDHHSVFNVLSALAGHDKAQYHAANAMHDRIAELERQTANLTKPTVYPPAGAVVTAAVKAETCTGCGKCEGACK